MTAFPIAGNWVWQRYANKTTTFWAGKKLAIKFDIDAKEGVTGGDGTQTNAEGSGVWVIDKETGEYKCINEFSIPITDLPINIVIKKDGLRHGESATFEIHKFKPLKEMPEGGTSPADSVVKLREEALMWLEKEGRNSGPLFLNTRGERLTPRGISFRLKTYADKYDIDPDLVHPHAFRHLFAKNFLRKNHDIALLADLLGHSSIETTRIYLQQSSREQGKMVNRIVDW